MNKNLKRIAILSHFHPQFHHILQAHTHTLKLTRWLPRHTTRRLHSTTLRATSEGSMTKVGLAIADKSGLTRGGGCMVHCLITGLPYGKFWAWRLSDPAACKPRDRTARPVQGRTKAWQPTG
jgi:hypothetical protein